MQKISQRILMQQCIESMEKVAAPSDATKSLLFKLLGNGGSTLQNKMKQQISAPQALKELLSSGNDKAINSFLSNTTGTLKKKLNAQELAKAKDKALANSDIISETGKALLKGKDLGNAAGAGALLGAGAGALQDTEEESTNMLGVTQKRKGKLSDRLKNMAYGAAIGAAGGAGLKAKNIAKKGIEDSVKAKSKGMSDAVKNLTDDAVLQKAFDSLAAGEYSGDVMQHLNKAYGQYVKSLGKADNSKLKNALDSAMFRNAPLNIEGLQPGKSGILENFVDSLLGRKAQRNAIADDHARAISTLLGANGQIGKSQAQAFDKLVSDSGSARDAFISMYRGKSGLDQNTLNNIAQIINNLNNTSSPSQMSKMFQNRTRPLPVMFGERPRYIPNILHKPFDWAGYSNPETLDAYLKNYVNNQTSLFSQK